MHSKCCIDMRIRRIRKIIKLLKQALLCCVCFIALTVQAMADPFSDAKSAYDAGNYAEAAKSFKTLAEKGIALAQVNLGLMYSKGQGVPQNYKQAAKW
jgi:hypothetical protein